MKKFWTFFLLLSFVIFTFARIHKLHITEDSRKYIALSTFGFYQGGLLEVNLVNFKTNTEQIRPVFGFSLDHLSDDAMKWYLDNYPEQCILEQENTEGGEDIVYFVMDLQNKKLLIHCNQKQSIHLYDNKELTSMVASQHKGKWHNNDSGCSQYFNMSSITYDGNTYYNASFSMSVTSIKEEGLYNLYFHNCPNDQITHEVSVDFKVEITEQNMNSFLSAREMPLPLFYSTMALLFLLSGMLWVYVLKQSKHPILKLHFMMAVLVFLKAISLAFHGLNYYYIERLGVYLATWALLFHMTNLLQGVLLTIILILIGTGWSIIKHVFTRFDKMLFTIIIPLKIVSEITAIISQESEIVYKGHYHVISYVLDLLCCFFILFPNVKSILFLKRTSQINNGKSTINSLFRYFYVLIVCYMYFTIIFVYVLKIFMPFQYVWLDNIFKETVTYLFFVITAYKFRPNFLWKHIPL